MTIIQGNFGRQRKPGVDKDKEEKSLVYQLHVSLAFSDPLIWRRLEVVGQMSLARFHNVLQICMGWSGEHNHQFYVGKRFYEPTSTSGKTRQYDESKYDLHSLEESIRWCFTYMYDAGDGWEHEMILEKTRPQQQGQAAAKLLDGEWSAPPETVGSVHIYTEVIAALESPPDDGRRQLLKQHDLMDFDPHRFDLDEINEKLRKITVR